MKLEGNSRENPILSITFNLIIPVAVLKNGVKWIDRVFPESVEMSSLIHFIRDNSSSLIFLFALIFPVVYFFTDLAKRKNINFISILGFINVLLTGGIGIFGSSLGLSRKWFILKEGMLPLIIGGGFYLMRKIKPESFKSILLNNAIFNSRLIHKNIQSSDLQEFNQCLNRAGYHFILGFLVSSIIQFILSSIIVVSDPGDPLFNEQVSTMTWVSYLAVLVPTMVILGRGYLNLISDIERITALSKDQFIRS